MSHSSFDRRVIASLDRSISATSSTTVPVLAPFTGEVLHELPVSLRQDVTDAYALARLAQFAWAKAGFAHRRRVLLRAHDLLLERRELLLDAVQTETGKTRGQAFEEVFQAVSVTRYNAITARHVLRGERRRAAIPLVVTTRVRSVSYTHLTLPTIYSV